MRCLFLSWIIMMIVIVILLGHINHLLHSQQIFLYLSHRGFVSFIECTTCSKSNLWTSYQQQQRNGNTHQEEQKIFPYKEKTPRLLIVLHLKVKWIYRHSNILHKSVHFKNFSIYVKFRIIEIHYYKT